MRIEIQYLDKIVNNYIIFFRNYKMADKKEIDYFRIPNPVWFILVIPMMFYLAVSIFDFFLNLLLIST